MIFRPLSLLAPILLLTLFSTPAYSQAPKESLPKVLLLGASVPKDGGTKIKQLLKGRADVSTPTDNSTDSAVIREKMEGWIAKAKPDVVHFSCTPQDSTQELKELLLRLKKEGGPAVVFGLQGPAKKLEQPWQATVQLMHDAGVPVHDLRQVKGDEALADCVMRHWLVKKYSGPSKDRPGGPEAAAKYKAAETAHDAEVPEMFKKLPIGKFKIPADAKAWSKQRPKVLQTVVDSLGDLPPRPGTAKARVISRELRAGYTLERVSLDNGEGNDISALVLVPEKRQAHAPAILWLHSSTPDKNALITPGAEPETLGEAFVRQGYVVMAPDAWWYGDRAANVPSGPRDMYRRGVQPHANITQDTLLKLNLWLGRTLWGMMVRDDQIALDYLCSRPEVDVKRIGATGMSMGSTRAWWLAAVDNRVAATVGVACLTRYENLIHHGNLKAHGLYYFSYGLLKHFDTEGVISLMAPRPFLALTGDLDYGSPVDGIKVIEEKAGQVYRNIGAPEAFKSILYKDTGHVYTPEMRAEMLAWFQQWLGHGER